MISCRGDRSGATINMFASGLEAYEKRVKRY